VILGDLLARTQTITGLRALADFLETNPAVPIPIYGWTLAFHTRSGSEECERTELHRIAACLDQTPPTTPPGAVISRSPSPSGTYRAVHIPSRRIDAYRALMTYSDNLISDPADHPDQGGPG
jgi:hypothetical protein